MMKGITKAHAGMWYDPAQSGHGFDIRVIGEVVAICVNLGAVPRLYPRPIWFSAQGTAGDAVFPLLLVNAVLGVEQEQVLATAGSVTFIPQDDGTLTATLEISAVGGFSPPPPSVKATLRLRAIMLDSHA